MIKSECRISKSKTNWNDPSEIRSAFHRAGKKQNSKLYDLEDGAFTKKVRAFVKKLDNFIANIEDGKQPIRTLD